MATIFKLIIEDDEGKTTVYPLADGEISIGRKDGNTIRLMERNVSRRHARLMRGNGAVIIEDLDSYNGIRINGERISGRYEVKEGDLVEIGDYHLALQQMELKDEPPAPSSRDNGWPLPGTVPDFRLPDEILADSDSDERAPRDTIMDQPLPPHMAAALGPTVERASLQTPIGQPNQPLVKPPPRGEVDSLRDLPPFPTPGGLPANKVPFIPSAAADLEESEEVEGAPASLMVGPSLTSTVPRLICTSTVYAGKEFALTRPELIIGRVEDNDIVIEHRSVSRNHAKILFDGRTHKIIDLQSANGILVNGEEYAMTDLRKGDLIELGHVRFRFIPAGEAFGPTEEEAREMRAAGVEPPEQATPSKAPTLKPMEVPTEVGAFDPSTAATVTDQPLNALNMGAELQPKIESKPLPNRRAGNGHVPGSGAKPEAPPKRATEDERPTELNRMAGRSAAAPQLGASNVSAALAQEAPPTRQEPRREDTQVPPRSSRTGMVVVLALLVVAALALVGVLLFGSPDGKHDQKLQGLFDKEQWTQVIEYHKAHAGEFKDETQMAKLVGNAEARVENARVRQAEEATPLPEDEEEILPETPTEEELDDLELKDPTQRVKPPPTRVKRPSRAETAPEPPTKRTGQPTKAARRARRVEDAKRLNSEGKSALLAGDLSKAEELLKKCIDVVPTYAVCHRALGVLYAQRDETAQAVKHYQEYVRLAPEAADATRVQDMIKRAQEAAESPR